MNKIFFLVLFFNSSIILAQSIFLKNAIEDLRQNINSNDFENVYKNISVKMKAVHSEKYYFNFFTTLKKKFGNLIHSEIINESERNNKVKGKYNGFFEKGNLSIEILLDNSNKIIGLYFKESTTL